MTKTATPLRKTFISLIVGAAVAVFALPGLVTAAGSQSFQISPPTANFSGDHGGSLKGKVKVTNLTKEPLSIRVTKENFVAKGEEGQIELVDYANPLYSLAPWFTTDSLQLDIPGLGNKEVNYTIAIPDGAEPGGRYGSLVFNTIPPKLPSGQSGASVQQRIAGIVFLRVNGNAKEEMSVASFAPDKSFYEYGPTKFMTRVKNSGNVHEKAVGTIVIKNLFGFKVDEIKLDEHFVIPGAIRRLHNDWPTGKATHRFLFGRYTAQLDAKYAGGKSLVASTSFTVIPYRLLGVILLILAILFFFFWRTRRRWSRAFRILAGQE